MMMVRYKADHGLQRYGTSPPTATTGVMARPRSSRVPSSVGSTYTRRMSTLSSTRRRSVGTRITVYRSPSPRRQDGAQPEATPLSGAPTEPELLPSQSSRQHLRRACRMIPIRFRDLVPSVPLVVPEHGVNQTLIPGRFFRQSRIYNAETSTIFRSLRRYCGATSYRCPIWSRDISPYKA